jgi:hypothetical protein
MATADPGISSWTPINFFAMLRALINNGTPIVTNAGAPTNGTSGTYAGQAGKGSVLLDYSNGVLYINSGTLASPIWTQTSAASTGTGPASAGTILTATGSISPANIIGTGAGQLGHANGVVLVPAAPALAINQLVSVVAAMDFATAAYTLGGNVSVNISGGGAALTGVVTQTVFIQAAADIVVEFVPLAATKNVYTTANGLALVSSAAPTNPGTAAGVINWVAAYRTISAILD